MAAFTSLPCVRASSASVRLASGPASTAIRTASGGRLRNAMPSANDRMIGNPNVQNTALGSRKKSRSRTSVSSTIAARGSVTQASSGERDEDVLEGRVARGEALERDLRRTQMVDERGKRDMQWLDREREAARHGTHPMHAG